MNNGTLNSTAIHLQSSCCDGKKDLALSKTQINGSARKRKAGEKHITLLIEPKSQYVGHFTAAIGSSQLIVNAMFLYFALNKISFRDVAAVGRDRIAAIPVEKEVLQAGAVKIISTSHCNG